MENGKWKMENKFKEFFRFGFLVFTLVCAVLMAQAQNGGTQQNLIGRAGTFAITGARIVTVSGNPIENGTIVIQDGKIAAIGANVSVPAGAERIDGKGLQIFPGMIDAATNLGLAEISGGVPASVDVAETGMMNPNAKAFLAVNPHSSHVNVTRVNGITTVMSMPVGGGIAGQATVINLNGSTQAEMAVVPNFGLVINFPRISTFGGFGGSFGGQQIDFSEAVKRRDAQLDTLKKAFKDTENYARAQEAYSKDKTLPYPETDIRLEAMSTLR